MAEVAIRLDNVSKDYKLYDSPRIRLKEALNPFGAVYHKNFRAINNVSLSINKGEILGVVGKNGCGKSTLLKLISGVLVPSEGKVAVDGSILALLELGSGFNPEFTGLQNIYFYGSILGFSREEMAQNLDAILEFADIGDFIGQPLKTYSSGMRARLGFAVAVHMDPDVLILDEVLSVGDTLFKRKCYGKMEELFSSGKTIIYVSHSSNTVNQLCTRAIFLDEGGILLDADASSVTKYYNQFLFANDRVRQELKTEMKDIMSSPVEHPAIMKTPEDVDDSGEPVSTAAELPYFAEGLKSQSAVRVQNHNVDLYDFEILSTDNKSVNVIIMDHEYTFVFKARLGIPAEAVSFAVAIKTVTGVNISRASVKSCDLVQDVKDPGVYLVGMTFQCHLLPRLYYIDVSATGVVNEERDRLCVIKDAFVFKVQEPEDKVSHGGLVSLNQAISVEQLNADAQP